MLKSMTGFGMVRGSMGTKRILIEVKSVNHKFCEVNTRFPPRYSILESKVGDLAKSVISRGRLDIFFKEESGRSDHTIAKIDLKKLKAYHLALRGAAKALHLPADISLQTLLNLPQVLVAEEEEDLESLWKQLKPLLKTCFLSLDKMRLNEGLAIQKLFLAQLKSLQKEAQAIEAWVPTNIELHRDQLKERIQKLTSNHEIDAQRLAQEVAYFVDRSDISEELQRLKQHIVHFQEMLQSKDPVGRKLDFLLQEMNREVNTLSAKAQNADVSRRVVECKHLLEKMREQVQNVE